MGLEDKFFPAALHGPAKGVPHLGLGGEQVEEVDPGLNGRVQHLLGGGSVQLHQGLAAQADLSHLQAGTA